MYRFKSTKICVINVLVIVVITSVLLVYGNIIRFHNWTLHVVRTDHSGNGSEDGVRRNKVKRLKIFDNETALKEGSIVKVSNGGNGSGANGVSGGSGGGGGKHGSLGLAELRPLTDQEIAEISEKITKLNAEQKIYNLETFGPVNESTDVIVIQVHSRVKYLNLLMDSLSRVQNIENALVIFSHDLYLPGLNEAIQNINFTRVMQIFYPLSIQLNPKQFPGQSPGDCPSDISVTKAKEIKCINADYPDVSGHYREARYPQIKHHWWWKANFVFGKLDVLNNYTRVISFLEEDEYVTLDYLWMRNLMETAMIQNLCHGCNLLSLGAELNSWRNIPNIKSSHSRAVVTNWKNNYRGMSFNKTLWEKLQRCAPTFCEFDDYNWDWTLLEVSYTCLPLDVLYAEAPRIFHIGDCGFHRKSETCEPRKAARAIEKRVKQYNSFLFPDKLTVELRRGKRKRMEKGWGAWGDVRDKKLCLSFVDSP